MKNTFYHKEIVTLCCLLFSIGSAFCDEAKAYKSGPHTLPGTIEVEEFDEGAEGVAYHDEDDVNDGGVYRTDVGVDIDTCGKGNFALGWTHKGEWLNYTINVEKSDEYVVSAIAASGLDGSGFSLQIDGEAVTQTISVPNTGSWTTFKKVSATTSKISEGKHTLKLYIESDYCNIDKISFRPKSEPVEYKFTFPTEGSNVSVETPLPISWTTNDEDEGKYILSWINENGDTTILDNNVGCTGTYEMTIPQERLGEKGYYTLSQVKIYGGSGLIPSDFDGANHTVSNPIIWADVPDVSVTRVEDTYYMVSTTMHMNPGVPVMASKDLVRWRTINYAHQALDDGKTNELNMSNGKNAYGKGSWASSIKYKDGTFYVLTPSYTTNNTHLYWTKDINGGKWESATLPFYHDPSLLLDDDGRIYVVYGSGNVNIVELNSDGKSTKGNPRTLINKPASIAGSNFYVECEGSQILKKNGYYYLFLISWPSNSCRSVLCYRSKSLTGNWEGKVLLHDNGVAQGRIVDTPDGEWYGLFFRDNGAVGRIPYLVNCSWSQDWPVLGNNGKVPSTFNMKAAQEPGYGIVTSDDFEEEELPLEWQWNHNPEANNWQLIDGKLRLKNSRTDKDVVSTKNTLTQRSFGPNCTGWVKLSTKGLKDGDYAGLVGLQEYYGFVGVKAANGSKSVIMSNKGTEIESVPLTQEDVYLRIDMNFQNQTDKADFYYSTDGTNWKKIGNTLSMRYELTHFVGYRYGLFYFSTRSTDGYADFDYFKIGKNVNDPIYIDRSTEKTIEETVFVRSANVTITEKSTTGKEEIESQTISVSPNPATKYVKINGVDDLPMVELMDNKGQIILTSGSDEIELPNLPTGIYLLRITSQEETLTEKLIVK